MQSHPLLVGLRLSATELSLLDYWLSGTSWTRRDAFRPGDAVRGLNLFSAQSMEQVREILGWNLPVLVIGGAEFRDRRADYCRELFRMGGGALWVLPETEEAVLFPHRDLPRRQGTIFLLSDDGVLRVRFRQIFAFAGQDLRVDFRSPDDVFQVMEDLKSVAGIDPAWPNLLVLDLDSARMDLLSLLHSLRRLTRETPALKSKFRILVMKDFARPGVNVAHMAAPLRAFAKRIFHPNEAILAVIEAFLMRGGDPSGADRRERPVVFRTMEEILFGPVGELPSGHPEKIFAGMAPFLKSYRRSLPFHWLLDYLETEEVRRGAILSVEPGVDAGDLLHGIGGPDPSRVTVEDPDE